MMFRSSLVVTVGRCSAVVRQLASASPEVDHAHAEACRVSAPNYVDPATGYKVFTEDFLRKRASCCGEAGLKCTRRRVCTRVNRF